MNIIAILLPLALALGLVGLGAFFWCMRTGSSPIWRARAGACCVTTTSARRTRMPAGARRNRAAGDRPAERPKGTRPGTML